MWLLKVKSGHTSSIVNSGTEEAMKDQAAVENRRFFSTAYYAEEWDDAKAMPSWWPTSARERYSHD